MLSDAEHCIMNYTRVNETSKAYTYVLIKLQPAWFDNCTKPYWDIDFISIYCAALVAYMNMVAGVGAQHLNKVVCCALSCQNKNLQRPVGTLGGNNGNLVLIWCDALQKHFLENYVGDYAPLSLFFFEKFSLLRDAVQTHFMIHKRIQSSCWAQTQGNVGTKVLISKAFHKKYKVGWHGGPNMT